ncbi:hypothetical protein [Bacillus sp. alh8]|uniref:hypothetical protein n=1 Tax=Bacillus sp. alh8 TaxID=3421242 RepID=UPI003D16539B
MFNKIDLPKNLEVISDKDHFEKHKGFKLINNFYQKPVSSDRYDIDGLIGSLQNIIFISSK